MMVASGYIVGSSRIDLSMNFPLCQIAVGVGNEIRVLRRHFGLAIDQRVRLVRIVSQSHWDRITDRDAPLRFGGTLLRLLDVAGKPDHQTIFAGRQGVETFEE